MKISLHVITPIKEVLKDEVDEITLPTPTGEISVLPNHADLVTKISPGEMVIKKDGKTDHFAITGGFLDVSKNQVNVLADYAIHAKDIEIAKAEEAKRRAEKAMKEKDKESEYEELRTEMLRTVLELKVARKHKSRTSS
jgi:F-type H+-transporting ATPase subunit epsilon